MLKRGNEGRRRRIDRKRGAVNTAELFRARMHVDEWNLGLRNIEQRVALRRQFAHAAADQDDEVRRLEPLEQFRIGPNAEVAGITGMRLIEQMTAAEGRRHRQRIFFSETGDLIARFLRPAAAAEE